MTIIILVIGSALLLRRYTIGQSATALLPEDRTMVIASWPMPQEQLQQVVGKALSDPRVRTALEKEGAAVFTAHVLPADYGMVNMFADVGTDHRMFSRIRLSRFSYLVGFVFPFLAPRLKNMIMGSPQNNFKVIFSRVDEPGRAAITVANVTDLTAKMTPVVIADIRATAPAPAAVIIPPRHSFWGDITMPMF